MGYLGVKTGCLSPVAPSPTPRVNWEELILLPLAIQQSSPGAGVEPQENKGAPSLWEPVGAQGAPAGPSAPAQLEEEGKDTGVL